VRLLAHINSYWLFLVFPTSGRCPLVQGISFGPTFYMVAGTIKDVKAKGEQLAKGMSI